MVKSYIACLNIILLTSLIQNCKPIAEPDSCEEGAVRMVDGIIEREGRVEICKNGVWGSVCDQSWDKTDAHIVCQEMGYPELGKTIKH